MNTTDGSPVDSGRKKGPHPAERIFLTGFSGSGKSTIAPLLAEKLGYQGRDTDLEIEKTQGISCTGIIEGKGLPFFRTLENRLLQKILTDRSRRCVIALGGGAVTIPGMISLLRRNGLVLWLRLGEEEILARLSSCRDRPLLRDRTEEEIFRFLREREVFYLQAAHLVVDVSGLTLDSALQRILDALDRDQERDGQSGEEDRFLI